MFGVCRDHSPLLWSSLVFSVQTEVKCEERCSPTSCSIPQKVVPQILRKVTTLQKSCLFTAGTVWEVLSFIQRSIKFQGYKLLHLERKYQAMTGDNLSLMEKRKLDEKISAALKELNEKQKNHHLIDMQLNELKASSWDSIH